ncbi:superoxide dismutase family protein [Salibacterium aidingense]|uniref:superoxide dismutase family protein n=1 Tax=Salibacterium aidingense TaxID=384933 RepID=UPI00040E5C47|nr:superoxide dismutase family protein [Salibacterium aidingense]
MKKYSAAITFLAVIGLLFGCNNPNETNEEGLPEEDAREVLSNASEISKNGIAEASMQNTDGSIIGNVQFYEKDKSVIMEAFFEQGVPGGFHGFHIHETGLCEPNAEDGPFTTAGGHFNPENTTHGSHAGDMPSLYGMEDGSAYLVSALDQIQPHQLANEDLAVIVHSGPDNFANIPDRYTSKNSDQPGPDEETLQTGDSGSRISCGVIEASNQ